MKTRMFHLFILLFLISACLWTNPIGTGLTLTPSPGIENAHTLAAAAGPNARSTIAAGAAGTFADFQTFAAEIANAIREKNVSFFGARSAPSLWSCLGDETMGVCKGRPAGQDMQGIPVTRDWATYQVYTIADYQTTWQSALDRGDALQLVAVANQFGDNPLMPLAGESFQAVITTPEHAVRVLYFEYFKRSWYLEGELVTVDRAEDWLTGNCAACYDAWVVWKN